MDRARDKVIELIRKMRMQTSERGCAPSEAAGFAGIALLGQADLAAWIGQVGFPIAVASFLLIRVERVQSKLREEIALLRGAIERLVGQKIKDASGED